MGGGRPLRLLLDTHVWLWSRLAPSRLGERIARELEDAANDLWLSPISVWETLLLAERGRLELAGDPAAWVRRALESVPVREAPLTRGVALASRALALPQQDPADRFIAATAAVYHLTLVTADESLRASDEYEWLAAGFSPPPELRV